MSSYIMPIIIIALLLYCLYKKINTYDVFVSGAKGSVDLVMSIFPYIAAIMIAVALLRVSGITSIITHLSSPIFQALGIPTEVSELVLLRPFTGSGSYALLRNIFELYGADSYIARCACCIMGSSETIFYVTTIYFSKTSVKKLLYAIPVALVASVVGAIVSCLFCRIM